MSINLPNHFSCTTQTAVFDGSPVDLRPLAQPGLPNELSGQLVADHFLISASHTVSTVSGKQTISFDETLIKVPVVVGGRPYLFPVVAWVTHEYSLIRGYLLGFHKLFAAGNPLATADIELDLSGHVRQGPMTDSDLPELHGRDWLLWTDYNVAGARSRGYARMDVTDYHREGLWRQPVDGAVGRLLDWPLVPVAAYQIADTFTVTGTTAL